MSLQRSVCGIADVLVVGAGPAGIAAAVALGCCPELPRRRTVWVDPAFKSGRLPRFRKVPCNTKVDLLLNIFSQPMLGPLQDRISPALSNLVAGAHALPSSTDPSELGWTHLGDCASVFDAITSAALEQGIDNLQGKVTRLRHNGVHWVATVERVTASCSEHTHGSSEVEVTARAVVLAIGGEPKPCLFEVGSHSICQEEAFDLDVLRSKLQLGDAVAVRGNSHSAAVVLSNLQKFAGPLQLRVANFVRRPVRLAEWMPEESLYRYTSTGLKGFGAVFGLQQMSSSSDWLQICPAESFISSDWDKVIDCTGYVRSSLPLGIPDGLVRDPVTGQLTSEFPNLFALGLPWGEPPGYVWGFGFEDVEGIKGEDSFIGFNTFFNRARLIARTIDKSLSEPTPAKLRSSL